MKFWRNLNPTHRTAAQAGAVVVFMASLGWASVPLYDLFCRVTGYGGTTSVASGSAGAIDQTMNVRFDGSKERDFPWEFKPVERTMTIPMGEVGLAFYEAYNPTDRVVAGTASYNVTPYDAGLYFSKIDCFCFELQVLQPGERVLMPVTFFVDPDILDDRDAKYTHTITLSYTFHETAVPDDYAATQALPVETLTQ